MNPRRPTPADLKSAPFDQARAPPHSHLFLLNIGDLNLISSSRINHYSFWSGIIIQYTLVIYDDYILNFSRYSRAFLRVPVVLNGSNKQFLSLIFLTRPSVASK